MKMNLRFFRGGSGSGRAALYTEDALRTKRNCAYEQPVFADPHPEAFAQPAQPFAAPPSIIQAGTFSPESGRPSTKGEAPHVRPSDLVPQPPPVEQPPPVPHPPLEQPPSSCSSSKTTSTRRSSTSSTRLSWRRDFLSVSSRSAAAV